MIKREGSVMPLYQFDMRPKVKKYLIIDRRPEINNCFFSVFSRPGIPGNTSYSYWTPADGSVRYFDSLQEALDERALIYLICPCDHERVLDVQPVMVPAT